MNRADSGMFRGRRLIIFDMDGTLIDSVGIWNEVDRVFISRIRGDGKTDLSGLQQQRETKLREFASDPNPYLSYCAFLAEKYCSPLTPGELHTLRYQIADSLLCEKVDYKPHAEELIHLLRNLGYTLAIASTTRTKNMEIYRTRNRNILAKAPIDECFSAVLTLDDVTNHKPDPEVHRKLMEMFHVSPGECLIFEDSLVGVEAANQAGIDCCAVYDSYSDGDRAEILARSQYSADDFSVLLQLLKNT